MSTIRLQKTLRRLKARHNQLIEELMRAPPMLRGSFSRVSTRCGKPTCWCAQSASGHTHTRMTWSEQGKMTTRKVPEDQVNRVEELTGEYRRFRKSRRELAHVQQQLLATIAKLESALNKQTRRPLSYLALTPKTAPKPRATARKTSHRRKPKE